MKLEQAKAKAETIVEKLNPYCTRIEVAGSIRREKPFVNDIDLVAIPSNQGQLIFEITQMGGTPILLGEKLIRYQMPNITIDIYIATPETWATLLLIRTGSAGHNIKLCSLAKSRGMKLKANGDGLFRNETRIAGDTEESIFKTLGLPYIEPRYREV